MLNTIYQVLKENPDFSMFVYIFTPLLLLIGSELVFIQFRSRIRHVYLVRAIQLTVNTALILSFCFWFFRIFN